METFKNIGFLLSLFTIFTLMVVIKAKDNTIDDLNSQVVHDKVLRDHQNAAISEWKKESIAQDKKIKHYQKLADEKMKLDIPYVNDEIKPGCENAFRYGVLKAAELAE